MLIIYCTFNSELHLTEMLSKRRVEADSLLQTEPSGKREAAPHLWDLTADVHVGGRRRDVAAEAPHEHVVQNLAAQPVEAGGVDTVVVGGLRGVLAGPAVVAGARVTGAVGGELALGPGEGRHAKTLGGALLARDARATIATLEAAAHPRVVLT